jgi:uncharacterized protein (TIGR03435 family)
MTIPAITIGLPSAALANHLWQSTLLAGVAGLLTLALKRNHARPRYWLWLAASVKFLIPFSLLVSAGSYWGWTKARVTQPRLVIMIEDISRPFSPAPASSVTTAYAAALAKALHLLPAFLLIAWFCGCLAVLAFWCLRWRRLNAVLRGSVIAKSGSEFEMLRRLAARAGIARRIDLIVSESTLEPGIVGIFRPLLLLPEGICSRLSDAQLEAIITHELCHLRGRDNLASAVHMLVEALFWFHPLIWWIGARLVDERERACDEEVLRLGSEPRVYAEGILKVCEFYLEAPLVCVAGVTGSNLKKRIEEIMIDRMIRKLNWGKKILLGTTAVGALAAPVIVGLLHPTPSQAAQAQSSAVTPGFQYVMIRPNKTGEPMPPFHIVSEPPGLGVAVRMGPDGFAATNATLYKLIHWAYAVQDNQISGGPAWINTERYDVDTKYASSPADDSPNVREQRKLMLQALLADRFKLAVHRELKELPVYELSVGASGSKLKEIQVQPDSILKSRILNVHGQLVGQQADLGSLVGVLASRTGHLVVDKTGLKGFYDFILSWPPRSTDAPFTGLREELGLELRETTALVETIVVDHAEPIPGDQP